MTDRRNFCQVFVIGPCFACGKSFIRRVRHERPITMYCSNVCIARGSAEKRGDYFRDSGKGKSYRKRGGRHEHRLVMETYLGRPLKSSEIVHHRDGNIRNNDISNLSLMTASQHLKEHRPAMWKAYQRKKAWVGSVIAMLAARGIVKTRKELKCRSQ